MSSVSDRIDGRSARRLRTRARIVEATMELHTTVGPAEATVSAIAERAGVQRHTVYAHFRDDAELFAACSRLWSERNPPPDPADWARVADPHERTRVALGELYAFWERVADDLAALLPGAERVPAMAGPLEQWEGFIAAAAATLLRGRGLRGARRRRALAAARLAVQPDTWRVLVERGGVPAEEAVALMAGLIDDAAGGAVRG
jgi:AcrR family transcriptional regulator